MTVIINKSTKYFVRSMKVHLAGLLTSFLVFSGLSLAQTSDGAVSLIQENFDKILDPQTSVSQEVIQNYGMVQTRHGLMDLLEWDFTVESVIELSRENPVAYKELILQIESRLSEDSEDAYYLLEAIQKRWVAAYSKDYQFCHPEVNQLKATQDGLFLGLGALALSDLGSALGSKVVELNKSMALSFRLAQLSYPYVGAALGAKYLKPSQCHNVNIPPSPAHLTKIGHTDLSNDFSQENEALHQQLELVADGSVIAASTVGPVLYRWAIDSLKGSKSLVKNLKGKAKWTRPSIKPYLAIMAVLTAAEGLIDTAIESVEDHILISELKQKHQALIGILSKDKTSSNATRVAGQSLNQALRRLLMHYTKKIQSSSLKGINETYEDFRKNYCTQSGGQLTSEWQQKLDKWHEDVRGFIHNGLRGENRGCYMDSMRHRLFGAIGHFGLDSPEAENAAKSFGYYGGQYLKRLRIKHKNGITKEEREAYIEQKNAIYQSWGEQFANNQFCDSAPILLLQAESYLSDVAQDEPALDVFVADVQGMHRFFEMMPEQLIQSQQLECAPEEIR